MKSEGETFAVGAAKRLFDARVVVGTAAADYDVAADGRRFLINAMQGDLISTPVTVVLNWRADVKR